MITKQYFREKFSVKPSRYGVTVFYDGVFWENADSYKEAETDINKVCNIKNLKKVTV